jgi:hypothetical protein
VLGELTGAVVLGELTAAGATGGEGGGGRSSRPPPAGGTSGEARDCWERAVVCGDVEVGELDVGHGREGDVV